MELIRRLPGDSADAAFPQAEAEMRAEIDTGQPDAMVRVDIYPPGLYEDGDEYVVRARTVEAPA